jgi:pseudomonalisin
MSRCRLSLFATLLLTLPAAAFARSTAPTAPGGRVVDEADRVVLSGNVSSRARPQLEIGRTDPGLAMERMILHLKPRAGAQAEIVTLLAAQQDPKSAQYHKWLTPEEYGARFGLADQDLQTVTGWLGGHGFTVDEVAAGRGWLNFTGSVAQVEKAFATEIHDFQDNGVVRHANTIDPSIPRALTDLVGGVASLNSFPRPPHLAAVRPLGKVVPHYDQGDGTYYLAPGDFATIYDLNSAYNKGLTGSGQTIGIVGRSDIKLADVQNFRSSFGLPANNPVLVHNGKDPGTSTDDESESDLDVEWSGAVAPAATVKLVISASTSSTDGVLLSAEYIVDQNLTTIMSVSYGACEADFGASGVAFYDALLEQAAAQGISAFSAAGDSGVSDCDDPNSSKGSKRGVDHPCSSPHNTCVGGTEFNDTANPAAYWSASNNATTGASALSYIPEVAWNESGTVTGGSDLWSTGGGVSTSFTKPSWQSAPGVPADGQRDVPDVALSAAAHDGYLVVQEGSLYAFSGTSCAAPTFAGIAALLAQQAGARQGLINPTLYQLATAQYNGGSAIVFHDVKKGNNSVPGVAGYTAGTAYDTVTGLGSVDAAQLLAQWAGNTSGGGTGTPTPCVANASTLCLVGGRFAVTATYNAGSSGSGTAQVVDLTDDTGYLWFFDASNVETVVKVLNGCAVGGHYWFFAGGLTNVNVVITVTDSQTGAFRTYTNPQSTAFLPIQDTAAFSTCP